jgi:hypothetical protein
MSGNQRFKLKSDQFRDGNPANKPDGTNSESENHFYEKHGNIRNVCFVWPGGKKRFLNYSYLVSAELNVDDETNTIILFFTSHTVTLRGYNLTILFDKLNLQIPETIVAIEARYGANSENQEFTVIEITIESVG